MVHWNRASDDGFAAFKIHFDVGLRGANRVVIKTLFLRCNMYVFDGFYVKTKITW